jgi:hypothetical protein
VAELRDLRSDLQTLRLAADVQMTGPEIFLAVMGAPFLVLGIVTYIRDNRKTNLNSKERRWRWISTVAFLSAGGFAVGLAIISAILQ